jgi:hypothetical protein
VVELGTDGPGLDRRRGDSDVSGDCGDTGLDARIDIDAIGTRASVPDDRLGRDAYGQQRLHDSRLDSRGRPGTFSTSTRFAATRDVDDVHQRRQNDTSRGDSQA